MFRPHLMACLLLAGAARTSDCSFTSGPNGLCATFRLEPSRATLQSGDSLRIRVNGGIDCTTNLDCVDCTNRPRHFRWRSSAPEIVSVDSAGLIRGVHAGAAEIRFESDEPTPEAVATTRVLVSP
jgi:hypothetical protein